MIGAGVINANQSQLNIPPNVWMKCSSCKEIVYEKEWFKSYKVCPLCGYHARLTATERISLLVDDGSFRELYAGLKPYDFLDFGFEGDKYKEKLAYAQKKTGLNDAVVTGSGKLNGRRINLGVFDFYFMGGSMGSVVGEKITRIMERSIEDGNPLVIVTSSGGARMQEGIVSLMTLAKTTTALARLKEKGTPYISVLTDPTTGGLTASFASLGDINIAEPRALIGFAGARVIEQTIRQQLPPGFQTSEFLQEHGFIDLIIVRKDLKSEIGRLIEILYPASKRKK